MPYDPTKPQAGTEIDAVEMRAQLQALYQEIQARATVVQMTNADNAVLQQSSANSNGVEPLNISVGSTYDEAIQQEIVNKINEIIFALRRL